MQIPPAPMLVRCEKQINTDCSGETWVAGKAEPISPRVAASLGEPMSRCTPGIEWTRRGVPFWEVNRSDGTMAPYWRDPDLLQRVVIALTVGQSAAWVALPCHQKPLLTKKLWFTHNIGNRKIAGNKRTRFARQSLRNAKATSTLQGGREGKTYNSLS